MTTPQEIAAIVRAADAAARAKGRAAAWAGAWTSIADAVIDSMEACPLSIEGQSGEVER